MKRDEPEHVLRAGAISGITTWVIVGSQAILGAVPEPRPDDRKAPPRIVSYYALSWGEEGDHASGWRGQLRTDNYRK